STVALYGSGHPQADVVLHATALPTADGPIARDIPGTLFLDPPTHTATFQASAGFLTSQSFNAQANQSPLLPAGTYQVTLKRGPGAFKDMFGNSLAGNGATPGTDYTTSFNVSAAQYARPTLYLPQFAQGPTQTVNVPSDTELTTQTLTGLPLEI